ncbi:MAG: hypothetical protein VX064_02295 [Pseudomonadota bacterium]|nr:hypothetical protein [Pseudomonadota bacterium]MEE2820185.1 hypothetical protein [Pseudomonadota bacterium]
MGCLHETRELNSGLTVDPDETLVFGGIEESKERTLGLVFQISQRRAFKSELLLFNSSSVL